MSKSQVTQRVGFAHSQRSFARAFTKQSMADACTPLEVDRQLGHLSANSSSILSAGPMGALHEALLAREAIRRQEIVAECRSNAAR